MEEIISKKYSKEQIEKAGKNYAEHLERNCTKAEVIRILVRNHELFFPDDLCLAHLS